MRHCRRAWGILLIYQWYPGYLNGLKNNSPHALLYVLHDTFYCQKKITTHLMYSSSSTDSKSSISFTVKCYNTRRYPLQKIVHRSVQHLLFFTLSYIGISNIIQVSLSNQSNHFISIIHLHFMEYTVHSFFVASKRLLLVSSNNGFSLPVASSSHSDGPIICVQVTNSATSSNKAPCSTKPW